MEGVKYDSEKLRYDLLPPECIREIVEILTLGAKKYEDENWKKVDNAKDRYYAALMRHLEAWREGEKIDRESGKRHLAHMASNAIFLLWFDINDDKEDSFVRSLQFLSDLYRDSLGETKGEKDD